MTDSDLLIWVYCKIILISTCILTCHLQTEDSSIHQLEGEYRSVISALRSKLVSRAAPPILHLDATYLQKESPSAPPFPTSSSRKLVQTSPSSEKSKEPWSLLTTWMNEIQKLRAQDGIVTKDGSQSETSSNRDDSPDVTWSATSEDFAFVETGDKAEVKSLVLPLPVQSTTIMQTVIAGDDTEMTADPRQSAHDVKTLSLKRKYRSLLHKRQIPGASGKSMCQTQF